MSEILEILKENENWLIRRILHYARERGYVDHAPLGVEDWTRFIQGITDSIAEGYELFGLDAELHPLEEIISNPLTAYGIHHAKQYGTRGLSLSMSLVLMKYLRQSYHDLIVENRVSILEVERCIRFIDQCFDRIEIAISTNWHRTDSGEIRKEMLDPGTNFEVIAREHTEELIRINKRLSREIDVRRSSERQLKASEEKLSRILDTYPDHVCIIDSDRTITWCNQASRLTFGKDITGQRCYRLYKGYTEACEECVANVGTDDMINNEQERLIKNSNGEERLLWCTTTVSRRNRDGAPVQILKICRDITERKRVERELRKHQRFIESIAEATPDVLFIFDIIEQRMIYSNQRILDHLGYSEEEIKEMGSHFLPKLLHPDDTDLVERHLRQCEVVADDEVLEIDIRMMTKSGEWRWYSVRDKVFNRDENGRGRQIVGVAHDISIRKDAEERLLKYKQQLSNLAMALSLAEERERHHFTEALHDGIGQNLYALKMMLASLESFLTSEGRPGQYREILTLIDSTIDDARTLTFELNPPILYELGLPAAIDWLVGEYNERTRLKIRHKANVDDERLGDRVRGLSYRAVRELLLNIEKHADADEVDISSFNHDGYIVINVADNGRGFDPIILKGEKGKYAGFGLFNIRERLEHLGGGIHVESKRGKGTSVILTIPQDGPNKAEEEYNVHKGHAG